MRSTLDILIAVKENQPVTPEELRLALVALDSIHHFTKNSLNDIIEASEERPQTLALRIAFAKQTRESMFRAIKTDPSVWLGPENIPGNPEHDRRYRAALALAKKAGIL